MAEWTLVTSGAFKGFKKMKMSKYFEIYHPKYVTFKIIPDSSVRNNTTELLADTIAGFYREPYERLEKDGFKIWYNSIEYATFEIDCTEKEISFKLSVPEHESESIRARIETCWPKATTSMTYTTQERWDVNKTRIYQLKYVNHPIYSLDTDAKTNAPLGGLLQGTTNIKGTDKAKIFIQFKPYSRMSWFTEYYKTLNKIKMGKDVRRRNLLLPVLEFCIEMLNEVIDIVGSIGSSDSKKSKPIVEEQDRIQAGYLLSEMSRSTQRKKVSSILQTGIAVIAQSDDPKHAGSICRAIADGYSEVKADNELIPKEITRKTAKQQILDRMCKKGGRLSMIYNKLSTAEAGKLMQLPGEELQNKHDNIICTSTREMRIPKELVAGVIPIGDVIWKGCITKAYWNATYNAMSKPKVIVGPSGGGKSQYIVNYVSAAANAGYGNIVFDYIKRCELSNEISEKIKDKSKIVNIDLSDLRDMISLTYCELQHSDDPMERFKIAFSVKEIVRELVENIQSESTLVMSSKMLKYLSAACLVVFIHPNESIFTVYQVLEDPRVRHNYIRKALESELFTRDSTEIVDLYSLDNEDKKTGDISTSEKKTDGIMDRLSVLVNGLHTRYMLSSEKHINFVELMEQNKTVLIRMPQDEFVSKAEKDIIVSCLLTKIWLAQQIRGKMHEKPAICNIIIDEIHQVKGSAKAIANIIPEVRKFGGSFVFAAQYFSQFGVLQAALSGTGSSYMLIAGSDKDILKTMKEEMAPFTIEEALKLPKFHSLNIIDNENERCVFVSKMPPV